MKENTAVQTETNTPAAPATPAVPAAPESQLPAKVEPAAAAPAEDTAPVAVIPKTLFNVDIFSNTPNLSKVFGLVATPGKDGVTIVAGGMKMARRKDMAKAFGLEGKANADKLDAEINQAELDAWRTLKVWLLSQPDDRIGLRAFKSRMLGTGLRRFNLSLDELSAKETMTVEKYAASFGLTVEELNKRMADLKKAAQGDVVDVAQVK